MRRGQIDGQPTQVIPEGKNGTGKNARCGGSRLQPDFSKFFCRAKGGFLTTSNGRDFTSPPRRLGILTLSTTD